MIVKEEMDVFLVKKGDYEVFIVFIYIEKVKMYWIVKVMLCDEINIEDVI